jgi:signal transduction histidine kinase
MMPGLLTKFGFFEAVEDLFEQINDSGKIKAEIYIEGEKIRLQENLEIMLYRIIQEMVNNTLKYAEAKNISLIIGVQSDKLNIQFSDDGKGFEVEAKLKQKTAGLTNIMSRVSFLKGEISIESLPGKGTILFLYIPLINNSMTN